MASKAAYTQYISLIARQCKRVPYDVPIVFTGLHGAGTWSVPPSLRAAGFTVHEVPEQRNADGAFTTVPGRAQPRNSSVYGVGYRMCAGCR